MIPGNYQLMDKSKSQVIYKRLLRDLVVFAAFWFYLWFFVETKLIYHGAGRIYVFPDFYCTWSYLFSFLSHPAGMAEYINAFVSQLFYYSWLGASVITIVCWLSSIFTDYILSKLRLESFAFIRFASLVTAAVTFGQYQYYFQFIAAFMVIQAFICLYLRIYSSKPAVNFTALLLLSTIAYITAGAVFYVFAAIALVYMLTKRQPGRYVAGYLALAAIIPYLIGVLVFKDALNNAYTNLTPLSWKTTIYIPNKQELLPFYLLYLLLPLTAIIALLRSSFTKKEIKKKRLANLFENWLLKTAVVSACWVLLFGIAAVFLYDANKKKLIEIDYYETQRNFSKVLETGREFAGPNYYVCHAVNHALSQTNRLSAEMFDFPQHPYSLFLTAPPHKMVHWAKIDALLDLGFINFAEHETREAIETFGSRPFLIKRLITAYLVNGNYEAAKTYLNQLSKTVFERKWATDYLERIENDPELKNDAEIQYMRSVMLEKQGGFFGFDFNDLLADLLKENPENKMAFEYQMALNLLTGQLEKMMQDLTRAGQYGYDEVPKYCQQAYLFYKGTLKGRGSLRGIELDPDIIAEYKDFAEHLKLAKTGDQRASRIMSEKFKDSYYLYYLSLPSLMKR